MNISKNSKVLLLAGVVTLALSSCKKDEGVVVPAKPSTDVAAHVNGVPIENGASVEIGATIAFDVTVNAPGGVRSLSVNSKVYDQDQLETNADGTSGTIVLESELSVKTELGTLVSYKFVASDEASQNSDTLIFEITAASPALNSFTTTLYGGFDSPSDLNSFYDAKEDFVYSIDDAFLNKEKIDFLFYYLNTNIGVIGAEPDPGYTLAGLNDSEVRGIFLSETAYDLEDFTPKNSTSFVGLIAEFQFENVQTEADLENAFQTDEGVGVVLQSGLTQLSENDVFGVVLDTNRGSKRGIIKVIDLAYNDDTKERSIELQIKIER